MQQKTTPDATGSRRPRWRAVLLWSLVALAALVVVVLVARWLRTLPAIEEFIAAYPGTSALPEGAPVGIPAWLAWQHFLNAFFLVLLVKTGLVLRAKQRPKVFWRRDNTRGIRTKGAPRRIGIDLWLHLWVDALWMLNGVLYVVLLFATGAWMRIVPTSWDIVPNAISAGIQYASLDWPVHDGWATYNGLQLLSYFATVFIAAPLAFVTGLRLSSVWPQQASGLNRAFPERLARAVHYPVMLYFLVFTAVHVTLVLATGILRNLDHMYLARDTETWLGLVVFALSVVVMVAAWVLARPALLKRIAARSGQTWG
ncbi:hypothetical protein ARHIZOSPH14_10220 [Agromyces rhizosphaerae]|uniref:Cytochrome b561 bacterial/Ni-hydrogenase domain-containing protein n=1 Tax=Agromyces rhizosphaerae TaxID=88374 RepID=A0A9W6CW45_9MICO|nr:cytochrome b/b6 domain-containing protein [Agromyces rhizosphaerae]GLI26780.1 hypothetical protein ARHIZOSPH14_10220 [Agromyces rhizosphaerae]